MKCSLVAVRENSKFQQLLRDIIVRSKQLHTVKNERNLFSNFTQLKAYYKIHDSVQVLYSKACKKLFPIIKTQ
jgi:hypothetical protein